MRRYLGRLHHRLDRFVVRRLYPQRPFLTFAPDAVLTNVTAAVVDGVLVLHVAHDGLIRGVNGYDTRVLLESGGDIEDDYFRARKRIDPLVQCVPAPTSTIARAVFDGGITAVKIPYPYP